MNKVLLIGSSGWVAHYLIKDLKLVQCEVIGISNKHKPLHDIHNIQIEISDEYFMEEVKKLKCDSIVNMLHSKDFELSDKINQQLSEYCLKSNIHYCFISSSNALDGDPSKPHHENELANGGSDYGKYKAKCESYVIKHDAAACIIRFPATHGYAPNRLARTEEFLAKLKKGEPVELIQGVYQNRPYVGHLSQMMARLILDKQSGVFHLGTHDQSDEIDFLTNLAQAFGYSKEHLTDGEKYQFHMTVYPKRIYELYGDEFKYSESDTIEALKNCQQLAKYKATRS